MKNKRKKANLKRNTPDRIMRMKDNGWKQNTQEHKSKNKYNRKNKDMRDDYIE